MAALRREVLSVYRRILRVSVIWEAGVTGDTLAEREYIRNETTSLFRKNREIRDPDEIRMCLAEASSRLEMALHYRNPYPRPVSQCAPSLCDGQQGQEKHCQEN
ncbi:LYR motif-containing protein 1-like isoform X2 [Halichondria panicea]|uniref:LYR motif-containing protein 1-like isoform X2 n=1 Tax=Halichondria panicea TaxID=6063 RepID=UPI00312B3406